MYWFGYQKKILVFCIMADLSEDTMIKLAENVKKK